MMRGTRTVRIRNGYNVIMSLYAPFRSRIYRYNSEIRDSGYYLKPVHLVYKSIRGRRVKYVYFGRYWYRVVRKGGSIKWIYVGRDKPDPHLPDPPLSPFEGIGIAILGDDVVVDEKTYMVLKKIADLLGYKGKLP
ncbi:MAG: hypothetical protein DRO09_03290 [Thermoprotei archaeon]|nr:MAG: hypothetical protein DRO09_03290 [Thermoprotei archaeon]